MRRDGRSRRAPYWRCAIIDARCFAAVERAKRPSVGLTVRGLLNRKQLAVGPDRQLVIFGEDRVLAFRIGRVEGRLVIGNETIVVYAVEGFADFTPIVGACLFD